MRETGGLWSEDMTDQTTFLLELGKRLCRLRKEQGLTQGQLGNMVRVTQQVIAEYEAGYRNIPVYRLVSLAEALNVSPDALLQNSIPVSVSRKRGPSSRIEQLAERMGKLPRTRQRFVIEMLENAVASAH